jgi:dephospho-CoA kinase
VILDIPLLFESGLDRFCGVTAVVATEPEIQLQRLLAWNSHLSEEDARGRIASQWDIKEKQKLANVVIENNSSNKVLEENVAKVVREHFSPSGLWTWLLRIPPIGLAFAFMEFLWRWYAKKDQAKTREHKL